MYSAVSITGASGKKDLLRTQCAITSGEPVWCSRCRTLQYLVRAYKTDGFDFSDPTIRYVIIMLRRVQEMAGREHGLTGSTRDDRKTDWYTREYKK